MITEKELAEIRAADKRRKHVLTPEQIEWAYEKWCIGYTYEQIAEALCVCTKTIMREFDGRARIRPVLIYDGG